MIRSGEILLYFSVPIYEFILVLEIIFLIKYWNKKLLYFFIFCIKKSVDYFYYYDMIRENF